jgi:hypothetical protein
MTVVVDDERMHIDPTPARRYKVHTGRSPIRLDDLAQVAQCGRDLTFERAVDVDVDITVRSVRGLEPYCSAGWRGRRQRRTSTCPAGR